MTVFIISPTAAKPLSGETAARIVVRNLAIDGTEAMAQSPRNRGQHMAATNYAISVTAHRFSMPYSTKTTTSTITTASYSQCLDGAPAEFSRLCHSPWIQCHTFHGSRRDAKKFIPSSSKC